MNPQTSEPIMNLWTSGPSDYRTFYLMILRATRQNPPQQLTYLSKSTENRIKNCMIDRCLILKQIHWYFKIILIVPFQSLVIVADYCRFYWDTKHHKIPTWFSWPSHTPQTLYFWRREHPSVASWLLVLFVICVGTDSDLGISQS